ncbi:MAG: class I SAM-dependent methyltransferase, partial [Acidobacteriota bacterium]
MNTEASLATNKALWDRWTRLHRSSDFYDVDGFRAGATSLQSIELEALGQEVDGKDLLHLQCHFGLDTLSWARLGARAVGVDLSSEAVRTATELAAELGLDARFVASDVLQLDAALDDTFDIVFTSYGVLDWIRDLDAWAGVIARRLRPGGLFYIVEFHPILGSLSEDGRGFEQPYFHDGEPIVYRERGSYAAPDDPEESVMHVWQHPLGDVVTALCSNGLAIESLTEYPASPYNCFPFLEEVEPGRSIIPGLDGRLPLLYSIRARR